MIRLATLNHDPCRLWNILRSDRSPYISARDVGGPAVVAIQFRPDIPVPNSNITPTALSVARSCGCATSVESRQPRLGRQVHATHDAVEPERSTRGLGSQFPRHMSDLRESTIDAINVNPTVAVPGAVFHVGSFGQSRLEQSMNAA
jgi:hypothetical protein